MLNEWINENKTSPYLSKEDKEYLAIRTQLTPNQVAIYLVNYRRKNKLL